MNDNEHRTIQALLPAYALGALEEEQATVAAHLAECPVCQAALTELEATLGLLALTAPPAQPTPGVKAALLARIDQEAQHASVPAQGDLPTPAEQPAAQLAPRTLPITRIPRSVMPLVALAAALIIGLLTWGIINQARLNQQQQQLAAKADEIALADTILNKPTAAFSMSAPTNGDGYGQTVAGYIYADPNSNVGLILAYWLPKINADQRFQIWLQRADGQRESAGTFTADVNNSAQVVVRTPANFAQYTTVGVTIEPAAGSAAPTGPSVCGAKIRP